MKFVSMISGLVSIGVIIQSNDIELRKALPRNAIIDTASHNLQITGASTMRSAVDVQQNGISYSVVLSKEEKVSFVITFDSKFRSKEDFGIGATFKELRKKCSDKGQFEPGYGYYFQLRSGWKALFKDQRILAQGKVADTCRIRSFFKRDY